MKTTNFLPWRRLRQQRCWRFWGLLFVGALLISFTIAAHQRANYAANVRVLQMHLTGDTLIQHELEMRHAQWRELNEKFQQRQQTLVLQAKTQAWQPALMALASVMPEKAWLTQLRYQQSSLSLTGYTATLSALTKLAESLKHLPGFTPGKAGELQQDAQGQWMFSFKLQNQE